MKWGGIPPGQNYYQLFIIKTQAQSFAHQFTKFPVKSITR